MSDVTPCLDDWIDAFMLAESNSRSYGESCAANCIFTSPRNPRECLGGGRMFMINLPELGMSQSIAKFGNRG
ncbi:MAG: hypothetical protein O3A00_13780 [Planctomycetota bacterium]|nr:hypothetical protein [Planctomycetota bacterium]